MFAVIDRKILHAIHDGDLAEVARLLGGRPELVDRGGAWNSWLTLAVKEPNAEIVRCLLDFGCAVEGRYANDVNPLESAIMFEMPQNVRVLLERGADPDPPNARYVVTAVVGESEHGLEMLRLLEDYGADIHRVFQREWDGTNINALSEAIVWGKDDVVEYLLSRGAVLPEQASISPQLDEGNL